MKVTKILVPIDYSGQSDRALQWGASLAEKYGARLLPLHVIPQASEGLSESRAERTDPLLPFTLDNPAVYRASNALGEVLSIDLGEMAQNDLKDLVIATLNERLSVSPTVGVGKPAEEIVRVARDEAVDLIVMGTHGRSGLRHGLLGECGRDGDAHRALPGLYGEGRCEPGPRMMPTCQPDHSCG
jgi:glycine betaine transporter